MCKVSANMVNETTNDVCDLLRDVAVTTTNRGVALIKHGYLVPIIRSPREGDLVNSAISGVDESDNEECILSAPNERKECKKNGRSLNKNRKKEMKQSEFTMRSAFVRLCPSVNQLVECKLGKKCVMEHDLSAFLSKKPKDIGNICPVYEARGSCPYNYACRFGDAHIDSHGNQVSKTPAIPYQQSRNGLSMHIQVAIRKKNFDFQRSYKVLEIMKADSVGAMEREKPKLDMKTLRGKKYLAPLTTVGNLPFRRLCVELGADITCTEMILATNLLSGYSSEYALLKRHSSEKLFGVQLAGGFADSMTKSAQILVDEMDIDFIDVNMGCPIDLVNQKGGGCALPNRPGKMVEVLSALRLVMKDIPLTVKLRSGIKADVLTADETITSMVANSKPDLITLHPRSKEQRYSKLANWSFVKPCIDACKDVPLWVCGDVLSWEDYYAVCCFHNEF